MIEGKRVLVTGGRGFLGRQLCKRIAACFPASLHAPARADCDLGNKPAAAELFRGFLPHVVFHLAAKCGGIGANQAAPASFFVDNARMGLNVVELCWRFEVEKLVIVGTCCSYPKATPVPFREVDFWNGFPEETNAPYGLAKKMVSAYANACRQQHGLKSITLIPANLYGPGDHFDLDRGHVIPALIRKAVEARRQGARALAAWGSGAAVREFLYVDDAADGIVAAADRYDSSMPLNLGSGYALSIDRLAEIICRQAGFAGPVVWDRARPDGQPLRWLDSSRAAEQIGWRAKVQLEYGLAQTIRHYEEKSAAPI